MAEAMTRYALGPGDITTGSAGVRGIDGSPIAPGSASALDRLGIPHAGHQGRMLTEALVDSADLILTMEAAHRDLIVSHQPAASGRTFTLREFARLVDGQAAPAGLGLAEQRRLAVAGAATGRTSCPPSLDDVPDPYGGPLDGYHTCAALLQAELAVALRPLLPPDHHL